MTFDWKNTLGTGLRVPPMLSEIYMSVITTVFKVRIAVYVFLAAILHSENYKVQKIFTR
jgi:hypothetical protein